MQLDAMNCKQEGNAQRRTHPIASKWEMPARSRVQSRAKKKCSKEGPPNYEQKRIARRKMRPIAIGGCGYAPIGGSIRIIARAASIAWRGSSSVGSASRGDLP